VGHRVEPNHTAQGGSGTGGACGSDGMSAQGRRREKVKGGTESRAGERAGTTGRSGDARRSDVAVTLVVEKHGEVGRRVVPPRGTRSAPVRLRTCCSSKATACRRTGKRGRGPAIRIGMRSFSTSMNRPGVSTKRGAPVVSVDAKKKELVGDFKNGGREWQPKGSPEKSTSV
jgi:hypothetical protein